MSAETVTPLSDPVASGRTTSPSSSITPSRSATALMTALVHETRVGPRSLRRRGLSAVRKAWLRAGDPAVLVDVDGTELALPLSHDLPLHRASHPNYSRNLGRVVAALLEERPDATVVDIGANVGDSVAIIRAMAPGASVLCVEGDEQFLPYLRRNVQVFEGIEVAPVYVSVGDGDVTVSRAGGTASLVDGDTAERPAAAVRTRDLDAILSHHPAFATPGVLKVDTDGHDGDILLRAEPVLRRAQPVVFFEFDPPMTARVGGTDPQSAAELLHRLGYRRALVYANTGELVASLTGDQWAGELASRAAGLRRDGLFDYFDVCAFGPADALVADRLVDAVGDC